MVSRGLANLESTKVILIPFFARLLFASIHAPSRAPKFIKAISLPSQSNRPLPTSKACGSSEVSSPSEEPLG